MKRKLLLITVVLITLSILFFTGCSSNETDQVDGEPSDDFVLQELPAPINLEGNYTTEDGDEVVCQDGDYSATCSSINVNNLDQYLNRSDVVYIDLRDYDNYAQKHFKNFEVVPYFGFIFNEKAHTDETNIQLFGGSPQEPIAVYAESEAILNSIFPKDKTIFVMCQSGARVTWMMQILDANGYDMSKIYNVGGLGQYTDAKYSAYITDTAEFKVEVNYSMDGATRN
ncbi:hypothetical protein GC105_11900 [Alkalibaculum sp. M08DMB]|uniref:Rhodanese domain-containing protein n=1 Tax=Alkalibaculum sporogenes TaxID=2655001 RepID=A0A6A7KAS5_9FIRM|nr:rhodanese-like domain-containing protein [Alkalibaculum sporogenes]MPW26494.1 hypothetical protein [Alkalibaculum sporogenes]